MVWTFRQKTKISVDSLFDAVYRAEQGQIDADLGGGVIKQRISRPGQSKSKGYRSIILFCKDEKSFFVFGFVKNVLANIREDEEEQFKKMAKKSMGSDSIDLWFLV